MRRTIMTSLCLALGLGAPVSANCIDAFMTRFDAYEQGQTAPQATFHPNELLVLCFTPQQSGFVSVFDAPIEGDFEQLYPNALTHPEGDTYAKVEAGQQYCFGGRDSFPLYHPIDEGVGTGKISITLTAKEDYQLDDSDYAIPGQKVAKKRMNLHLSKYQRSAAKCSARDVTYLEYRIVN